MISPTRTKYRGANIVFLHLHSDQKKQQLYFHIGTWELQEKFFFWPKLINNEHN